MAEQHGAARSYVEGTIANRWLVERHGLPRVVAVTRHTDARHAFARAFAHGFGSSPAECDPLLEAALRAEALGPRGKSEDEPPKDVA